MLKIDLPLGLAFGGLAATILLVVLDKAGKLKGPLLLWLLAGAMVCLLPVAIGSSWVADAPTTAVRYLRSALGVFVVGSIYFFLASWIAAGELPPPDKPNHEEIPITANVELTPSNAGMNMWLRIKNLGDKGNFHARCELIALRNSPNRLAQHTFDLKWEASGDRAVAIDKSDTRNLLIATVKEYEKKHELAEIEIMGLGEDGSAVKHESARWNIYPRESLPEFDIEISIFEDGKQHPLVRRFTVRPKASYGPLEMFEAKSSLAPAAHHAGAPPDLEADFLKAGKELQFVISNAGGDTAQTPAFQTILCDLDNGSLGILPIPRQTGDFLRPRSSLLRIPILNYGQSSVMNLLKPTDRVFGWVSLMCANCIRQRWYWVYFNLGTAEGWYSEAKTQPPSKPLFDISNNPNFKESDLDSIVSVNSRKAIVTKDGIVRFPEQGTLR